jgi:mono/diheme cytochrome c family protein
MSPGPEAVHCPGSGADETRRWRRSGLIASAFLVLAAHALYAQGDAAPAATPALTAFARAKAETLLRDQLPCLGCHALGHDGGTLAPDLATVRQRRTPAYIARMVSDPQGTVAGTIMPHTPMPGEWRALVIRYLGGNAAASSREALRPVSSSPADSNGAALYTRFCSGCHGAEGKGDGPNARSLPVPPARHASSEAMSARPDDSLYDTIAGGGAIMNRSPRMPAYGTTLSPPQIRALVRHIRTLCKCAGPAWSTDGKGP